MSPKKSPWHETIKKKGWTNVSCRLRQPCFFDEKLVQVSLEILEMSTPVSGWCRKNLIIQRQHCCQLLVLSPTWVSILSAWSDAAVVIVLWGRVVHVNLVLQILPLQGNDFHSNMIAVGNRVFLRRGCQPFFSHGELCHFIAKAVCWHAPGYIAPMTTSCCPFPFFWMVSINIHKLFGRPIRKALVIVGDFSAKVKGPKGRHVATLDVFVVWPVGRSDLALKEDELWGTECRTMEEGPCVVLMFAERRWQLKVTGIRKREYECQHVGGREFNDVGLPQVVVW